MFRTLAGKAIVPVACTITGFVVVCCILLYASMKRDRIQENILHAHDITGVLVKSTRYAMLNEDRETLRNIVSNVNEERIVDHVRIFNKQGVIVFSGAPEEVGREMDKDAEGCSQCHKGATALSTLGPMDQARRFTTGSGDPVLAITAAIFNEPECSNAECHYHPPSQTVLGTLDIGLSEGQLAENLRLMRRRLAIFSVMVLVLSVGGVAALLQVSVVTPVRGLAEYARGVASGEGQAKRPRGSDDELGEISEALERIQRAMGRGEGETEQG